jgi:hypothetical protein
LIVFDGLDHYEGMPVAAAAGQGGSNLTLLVAILGIAGTLTAAFVTQLLTSRRDDKQWKRQKQLQDERFDREREREEARWQREREQEETRWERERRERREQWEREDAARLHQDRMTVYSKLILSVETVHRSFRWVAAKLLAQQSRTAAPTAPNAERLMEELQVAAEANYEVRQAREAMVLIGSRAVRHAAGSYATTADTVIEFLTGQLRLPAGERDPGQITAHTTKAARSYEDLSRCVRQEIGSESEAPQGTVP